MASTTPSSNGPLWFLAIGAALVTTMLVAVVVPRFFLDGEANWILSILAGVIVGAAVVLIGLGRTNAGRTERPPPDL